MALKILNQILRYLRFRRKVLFSQATALYMRGQSLTKRILLNLGKREISKGKAQIILDPVHKGWVMEKMARMIVDYWPTCDKPSFFHVPRSGFELTHWMHFMNVPLEYLKYSTGIHTVQVTHVDSPEKLNYLEQLIKLGAVPVFMSKQHSTQVSKQIEGKFNSHVILPGSDVTLISNRKKILISSNYYPDGRKNENFLVNLAKEIRMDGYHFTFIGKSWEEVAKFLVDAGAQVELLSPQDLDHPSYETQLGILKGADCYLYLGFDEGSLGALDAYLSGTPMLISKQGFHMEFKPRTDVVLFEDFAEFKKAFIRITQRNQISSSELLKWSWYSFSSRYEQLWNFLIDERRNSLKRG